MYRHSLAAAIHHMGWAKRKAPPVHEDKPTGLGSHLKVPLVLFPDNSGHGMEFAMTPSDSAAESAAESAAALQDGLLSSERDSEAPAEDRGLIPGLRDDGNRLAAVRGIVIGTVVGIIIWAAILWVAKGVLVG